MTTWHGTAQPHAKNTKPFGIAVPFFGEPERFNAFTPLRIAAGGLPPMNGETPDYLRVDGRAPEGAENVEPADIADPAGILIPVGVDFEKLLQTGRGLKFNRRVEGNETSLDYHGINNQPCLIQGTVHEANRGNPRCSERGCPSRARSSARKI